MACQEIVKSCGSVVDIRSQLGKERGYGSFLRLVKKVVT
jgi:hypothetical protein